MNESMRQQAARLADEVEASGIVGWHAKVNFVFLFAAALTGVYGVEQLRKALGGQHLHAQAEGGFNEFARGLERALPKRGPEAVADGD